MKTLILRARVTALVILAELETGAIERAVAKGRPIAARTLRVHSRITRAREILQSGRESSR